ncbi:MAG: lipoprotein-releasing system ATP-binding protein LolD [Ignavibacteriae bacterium HGW-Ignavibacteriae-2]|jgi:lipoprotein-releasing system ATP-binding protein|nr:MAG: lipoprotein-releasing system ATP-binding protein LolD [Ignavibacteriae bacterium HGW-Ignavibacteriae-2]
MSIILSCNNIERRFLKGKNESLQILKGVSLEIETNKITVIVGASGAGKSTLLHILGGLDKPTAGTVLLNSKELYKLDDFSLADILNKDIGFVFQFHHLLPEFSALENINIPQMIAGKKIKEASERSRELLEIVGLSERSDHKPSELSGGEQQRVAVARALANNPKIILADEPTGNLDTANSTVIHELFIKLKNEYNQTLLVVTHNPELVKIADRVIEMKDGLLV